MRIPLFTKETRRGAQKLSLGFLKGKRESKEYRAREKEKKKIGAEKKICVY